MRMAERLTVAIAVCGFDRAVDDPEALLDQYHAPHGWADAVLEAGADVVTMVHRFSRDAHLRRGSVDYQFVADGGPALPSRAFLGVRITNAVARLAPTVVHVDGLVFPMVVRHLRWRLGRRAAIVVQDHGGLDLSAQNFDSWGRKAVYRFGLGAADGFMFTTRAQAAPFLRTEIIGSPDDVHEVLESSTDLGSWSVGADGGTRLPGRPALLWVGRLDANKDPLTVLDGFEQVCATLPDAALTLVYGDDILLPEVKARIARSPALSARVHLRGRLPQSALPALYAGADLFVLGSHREVACFSLIEAMSFGVIPVVTDIPPFRAIVDLGRLCALFTPGDPAAFARAVERVARDDLAAGHAAVRQHFAQELSWQSVGARAVAVYRAAARARRLRGAR